MTYIGKAANQEDSQSNIGARRQLMTLYEVCSSRGDHSCHTVTSMRGHCVDERCAFHLGLQLETKDREQVRGPIERRNSTR